MNGHFAEVPPPHPDALLVRNAPPILTAIVGAVKAAVLGINDQINSPRVTRGQCDAHASEPFRRQPLSCQLLPVIAAVLRTIKPAARAVRRRIDAPRWPPRLPESGINRARIARLEGEINRTSVFVVEENAFPGPATVCGTIDAPFG